MPTITLPSGMVNRAAKRALKVMEILESRDMAENGENHISSVELQRVKVLLELSRKKVGFINLSVAEFSDISIYVDGNKITCRV